MFSFLTQLDTRTRLCIQDSLVRLAHSATERHIAGDRSSTNKNNKDEATENDTSSIRKRYISTLHYEKWAYCLFLCNLSYCYG
jgi:hypothetical protein